MDHPTAAAPTTAAANGTAAAAPAAAATPAAAAVAAPPLSKKFSGWGVKPGSAKPRASSLIDIMKSEK